MDKIMWYTDLYFLYLLKTKSYQGGTLRRKEHSWKRFLELNRNKLYSNAEDADDITLDDEWMQENQWDEIYKQGEKKNGKI